jgi:hypothetical protein
MVTPGQNGRDALPPRLLNNDPQGFAWGVWHHRTPQLITGVRDAHPYGPDQRRALDDLWQEINSGVIRPLRPDAHDHEIWSAWGKSYFGTPWLDAPFLWSESYFYRRLLDAVQFFGPGPWQRVDPFEYLKFPTWPHLRNSSGYPSGSRRRPSCWPRCGVTARTWASG